MNIANATFRPRALAVLAGASLALFGQSALAAITVTAISGTWTSVTGGSNLVGVGTNEIRWGGSTGAKSGYNFTGEPTPFDVLSNGTVFDVGTFTHFNNPIPAGTSITAASLRVDYALNINGSPTGVLSSFFDFDHWETDNGAAPCADGGTVGVGVNINGCADRVTFALNTSSINSFTVDGIEYVLTLSGFLIGGETAANFWTTESADNSAILQGKIVERSSVVPIPAAAWLLGSGLLGLFGLARRKQQAAA